MKVVRNLLFVAIATLLDVSAMADGGKKAPQALKVDTKASTFGWLGKKFTGEHNGTVAVQNGSLLVNSGKLTGGEFTIDMNSIECLDLKDAGYNTKLIGHLKSPDFFDVAKFPASTFKITKVTPKSGENYDITGDLTIKGIKQSITFPATVAIDKKTGAASATAKFEVDRSKFDIKYNSKSFFENIGDKIIYDNFQVDLKLVAAKPSI